MGPGKSVGLDLPEGPDPLELPLGDRAIAEAQAAREHGIKQRAEGEEKRRREETRLLLHRITTVLSVDPAQIHPWWESIAGYAGAAVHGVQLRRNRNHSFELEAGLPCARCHRQAPASLIWRGFSGLRSLGELLEGNEEIRHRPGCDDQLDEEGELLPEHGGREAAPPAKPEPELRLNDAEQRLVKAIRDVIYNAQPRGGES